MRLKRRVHRLRQKLHRRRKWLKPRIQSVQGRMKRQRVIHLLHIGKTGGSAVKEAIRGDIRGVQSVYQDVAPGTRIVAHGHQIDLSMCPPGDDVVFILRDPVSRYVSGFLSRLRQGAPRHDSPWSKAEEQAFTRFPTPNDLAEGLSADDAEVRAAADRAMRDIHHVRKTFADWLVSVELVRKRSDDILLVGWQETLDQDFERLRELISLPASCRLPTDPQTANRAPDDTPRELSETGTANIRVWYAEDYDIIAALEELGLTTRPAAR